jgi:hypothetical protein
MIATAKLTTITVTTRVRATNATTRAGPRDRVPLSPKTTISQKTGMPIVIGDKPTHLARVGVANNKAARAADR